MILSLELKNKRKSDITQNLSAYFVLYREGRKYRDYIRFTSQKIIFFCNKLTYILPFCSLRFHILSVYLYQNIDEF